MRRFIFSNEDDFLHKLDGKVYAVSDYNGHYLCDILEDDYLKLIDSRILVDTDEELDYTDKDTDSSVLLTIDMGDKGKAEFKEKYGLQIDIEDKGNKSESKGDSLEYEIDSLILSYCENEEETPFIFMDGIAIEIESLDSPIPKRNPRILIYPQKKQVINSVRIRDEIEDYRGHSWDGDIYSIALLYGKERKLKK